MVRSVGSGFLRGLGGPLTDGEVIDAAGLRITVMATPGHTADSVSFLLDDAVLTADTVLGRGTTVIDNEDGSLGTTWNRCSGCGVSVHERYCPATARISTTWKRSATCTWRTARSDSIRCAARYANSATTPPRDRSSSTSTPTSTKSYGTQPNGASKPRWTTCRS